MNLEAAEPTVGTGVWTSLTGADISNPDLANTEVANLEEGDNIFVWTLSNGACENYDADTVVVTVSLIPNDLAFAGADFNACGEDAYFLSATTPIVASGMWTQSQVQASLGVVILDPTDPETGLSGLQVGNTYEFFWTLSQGVCEAYASDAVSLTVYEEPLLNAHVLEHDVYSCGEISLDISATEPGLGYGIWTSPTGATIVDPYEATAIVDDLTQGENIFIWTLSEGPCENYSSDTMSVFFEGVPTANADIYNIFFADSIYSEDVLVNDELGDVLEWDIRLIEGPKFGSLEGGVEDGIFNYVPDRNYFGVDEFIYELCNVNCPTQCDTAIVKFNIAGTTVSGDCWVPNIISPNGDGANDAFVVPCLDAYPNNKIRVYNRWGDRVYAEGPYLNDWEGTYRGERLPPGTYFYIIELAEGIEPLQGYFTLLR